jgi:hypothetical protein
MCFDAFFQQIRARQERVQASWNQRVHAPIMSQHETTTIRIPLQSNDLNNRNESDIRVIMSRNAPHLESFQMLDGVYAAG